MKICSRELTPEEYTKARAGMYFVRNLVQHGLSNYTTMREQGHPVTDEMINAQRLQLDAMNIFYPGDDDMTGAEPEETLPPETNAAPPAP